MCHISNPSSSDGHVSFLHGLAIINSAVVNMAMQISLQDPDLTFLNIYPEVVYIHMIILFKII